MPAGDVEDEGTSIVYYCSSEKRHEDSVPNRSSLFILIRKKMKKGDIPRTCGCDVPSGIERRSERGSAQPLHESRNGCIVFGRCPRRELGGGGWIVRPFLDFEERTAVGLRESRCATSLAVVRMRSLPCPGRADGERRRHRDRRTRSARTVPASPAPVPTSTDVGAGGHRTRGSPRPGSAGPDRRQTHGY